MSSTELDVIAPAVRTSGTVDIGLFNAQYDASARLNNLGAD